MSSELEYTEQLEQTGEHVASGVSEKVATNSPLLSDLGFTGNKFDVPQTELYKKFQASAEQAKEALGGLYYIYGDDQESKTWATKQAEYEEFSRACVELDYWWKRVREVVELLEKV